VLSVEDEICGALGLSSGLDQKLAIIVKLFQPTSDVGGQTLPKPDLMRTQEGTAFASR